MPNEQDIRNTSDPVYTDERKATGVSEPAPAYRVENPPQLQVIDGNTQENKLHGDKTIEDYLALPEDVRVEMIDGVFYDMASPSFLHQSIVLEISGILRDYIKRNSGSCIPFIAPMDVQLTNDDKTIMQPDVFVVCDRTRITGQRFVGVPDLVVEVVSSGSRKRDTFIKKQKYEQAGVREYWIVYPIEKRVQVYYFEEGTKLREYTFEDKIPVAIWNGRCEVDFAEIYAAVAFLYSEQQCCHMHDHVDQE